MEEKIVGIKWENKREACAHTFHRRRNRPASGRRNSCSAGKTRIPNSKLNYLSLPHLFCLRIQSPSKPCSCSLCRRELYLYDLACQVLLVHMVLQQLQCELRYGYAPALVHSRVETFPAQACAQGADVHSQDLAVFKLEPPADGPGHLNPVAPLQTRLKRHSLSQRHNPTTPHRR